MSFKSLLVFGRSPDLASFYYASAYFVDAYVVFFLTFWLLILVFLI